MWSYSGQWNRDFNFNLIIMYMPSSLPSIFPSIFGKQPTKETPAQAAAKRADEEVKLVRVKPPENTSTTTGRPTIRGRRFVERKDCICREIIGRGSFKKAYKLQCAVGDICDERLNQYTDDRFVALIQNIEYENENEKIEEQWKNIKDEIERQLQFHILLLSLDIPLILLKFKKTDKPTEFIYKDEFEEKLYTLKYPEDLESVILIMRRMHPAGPRFDVLGLAKKLIRHRVMSCDYKYDNTGEYDGVEVLSDWDTQYQTYIGDDKSTDRELVCFMMLEYIMHLLILVYNASNNIRPAPETGIDVELENRINLFTHVRGQLKEYYPEIFTPETKVVGIIKNVLFIAYDIFEKYGGEKKGLTMFQNLDHYNPFKSLVKDHKENELFGDIHKILQMEITYPLPHTMSIAEQIKTQYTLLTPKGSLGGSRKRPKTKRRRSYKKKKGTRKMFR
jgi:hypothetical protein